MKVMCFRILLVALCLSGLCAVTVSGQLTQNSIRGSSSIRQDISTTYRRSSSIRGDITTSYNANTQLKVKRPAKPRTKVREKEAGPQYVLYRGLVRRNLWLEGVGQPISQKTADKLPCYFRLSMKNDKGHYCFVEALCGDSLTSRHTVSPYIMKKRIDDGAMKKRIADGNDSVAAPADSVAVDSVAAPVNSRELWAARLATVGQWMITPDLSGERVAEERAYEAREDSANLVYAFQPIYNDSVHVTCSYTDSWGLPIDINESDDHYYGSVVYLTLDSQGLDSIVDYLDAKGLCRDNEYGAGQTRYTYDSRGRLTSETSHNPVGGRLNDHRGICGTIYEYDDAGNSCVVTHIDRNNEPVELFSSDPRECFVRARISYDGLGRESEVEFLDKDYAPVKASAAIRDSLDNDVSGGISRIRYSYPDGGGRVECEYFDLAGRSVLFK